MKPSKYNIFLVPSNMVVYTYAPRSQCSMKYMSKAKAQTQVNSSKINKKKNKGKNRSKEVDGWDDIPGYSASKAQARETDKNEAQGQYGKWVRGTIPMKTIKQMKWGDINDLTDEEYGYFQIAC